CIDDSNGIFAPLRDIQSQLAFRPDFSVARLSTLSNQVVRHLDAVTGGDGSEPTAAFIWLRSEHLTYSQRFNCMSVHTELRLTQEFAFIQKRPDINSRIPIGVVAYQ